MKIRELFVVIAFALVVGCTLSIGKNVFSVDPLILITDLITGFLNLVKDLFFGWFL